MQLLRPTQKLSHWDFLKIKYKFICTEIPAVCPENKAVWDKLYKERNLYSLDLIKDISSAAHLLDDVTCLQTMNIFSLPYTKWGKYHKYYHPESHIKQNSKMFAY